MSAVTRYSLELVEGTIDPQFEMTPDANGEWVLYTPGTWGHAPEPRMSEPTLDYLCQYAESLPDPRCVLADALNLATQRAEAAEASLTNVQSAMHSYRKACEKAEAESERKVMQITSTVVPETEYMKYTYILTALCDDGTMWERVNDDAWKKLVGIPVTRATHE